MIAGDSLIYRKADEMDIPQLVKMRIDYLTDDYGELEDYVKEKIRSGLPEYFERHLTKDMSAFVAIEDEDIIATVLLLIIEKPANPSYMNGKIGNVLNVYTRPEYRRKGLAKTLMQMLIKESEEKQLDFIELKATKDGFNLYKQLGFKEVKSKNTDMKMLLQEPIFSYTIV